MKEIIDVPERGSGPAVWVISNQQWPRAFIRAELIERGFDAIGFEEAGQAIAAIGDKRTIKPRLLILDLRQSSLTRIQLHTLAHKKIPILALAGNLESEELSMKDFEWIALVKTPFTIGEVCDLVQKEIGPKSEGTKT